MYVASLVHKLGHPMSCMDAVRESNSRCSHQSIAAICLATSSGAHICWSRPSGEGWGRYNRQEQCLSQLSLLLAMHAPLVANVHCTRSVASNAFVTVQVTRPYRFRSYARPSRCAVVRLAALVLASPLTTTHGCATVDRTTSRSGVRQDV
jgi:hypothetical protein